VTPETLDLIAGWVSLVLTLMVFSYLLSDNVLYRLAVHVLVGVAAAYIAIVAVESVLVPWVRQTLLADPNAYDQATLMGLRAFGALPFLGGALLLLKFSARLAPIGDLEVAFLIGVGLAVAVVGAVSGTIVPMVRETGRWVQRDALEGVVMVVGVVATLLYFQYLAVERQGEVKRPRWLQGASALGRAFVMVTLGALYAGAIIASLSVFSDVVRAQVMFILDRVGG